MQIQCEMWYLVNFRTGPGWNAFILKDFFRPEMKVGARSDFLKWLSGAAESNQTKSYKNLSQHSQVN